MGIYFQEFPYLFANYGHFYLDPNYLRGLQMISANQFP